MKRFLLSFFLVLVFAGGFAAWWFLRDTPDKVLHDGMAGLIGLQTAAIWNLDVGWRGVQSNATTGFTLVSQADLSDLTHPRLLGGLRIGAVGTAQQEDQTGDIVLEKNAVAVRPRSVNADWQALAQRLSGTATGTIFLAVNRDAFLRSVGYGEAIAKGNGADVRSALSSVYPVVVPSGAVTVTASGLRTFKSVPFRLDKQSVKAFVISLVRAWANADPSADEYAWVDRVTSGIQGGTYVMTIDAATRKPVRVSGAFDAMDDAGAPTGHVTFTLDLDGIGQPVGIGIPGEVKDVTAQTVMHSTTFTLPSSGNRAEPFAGAASGTGISATGSPDFVHIGNVINEKDIDLFSKYSEELRNKKKQ